MRLWLLSRIFRHIFTACAPSGLLILLVSHHLGENLSTSTSPLPVSLVENVQNTSDSQASRDRKYGLNFIHLE